MNLPLLLAEVMDKEPSLKEVLFFQSILCLISIIACFFLAKHVRWLFLACIPVLLSLAAFLLGDILDPFVGPAIWEEAGPAYVYGICCGAIMMICIPIVGGIVGVMHSHQLGAESY